MDSKVFLLFCVIHSLASHSMETDISGKYSDPKDLANLINKIGQYWNMSSIYIIYNSKVAHNRYVRDVLEELHQKDAYFAQLPHMTVTDADIERQLYEDKGFGYNSLVLTLMHSAYDNVLKTTAMATRTRRTCFTIFLVQLSTHSVEQHNFFEQLWKYQLRRPLVIVNDNDLLTMDPYPKMRIVNVSEEHVSKMFPLSHNIKNFKGYTMELPVKENVPFTFWYKDEKTQKYRVDGMGGWIISELMDRLNVTMDIVPLHPNNSNFLDIYKIYDLLLSGQIEISPHLSTTLVKLDLDYSYPFVTTSRCVMMPIPKRDSIHFFHMMHWTVWLLLGSFLFGLELLWLFCNHYAKKRFHISKYWSLFLICVLLGIPVPLRIPPFKRMSLLRSIRIFSVFIAFTIGGYYISQFLSSNLTSTLTASYFRTNSARLEDLLASDIPFMMLHEESKSFIEHFKIKHEYLHHFVNVSWDEVNVKRSNFNVSYMYMVSAEEFKVIDKQQKYTNSKRFILTDICHGTYPYQIPLRADSQFTDQLNMFILRLRESGIYYHQKSNLFQRAKEHSKIDYIREPSHAITTRKYHTINTMTVMFLVLSVGYTCSIVVFLMERYGLRFLKRLN